MARLRLSMLGPLEVVLDGDPVTSLATSKARALLAYLAVEAGRPHPREVLSGLLWPDWPERSARANLRNALSSLRKAIGDRDAAPSTLLVTRETIQFNRASDCWVDVTAFEELAQAHPVDDASARRLERAVALYRGPCLEGFAVADSAPFEDWALVVRERLERRVLATLQSLTVYEEERGAYARAREHARRRVGLAPWQEQAHRDLMRLLALSGQRGAALAQYEACRRALREELDVEPGEGTTRLYQRIRDGELGPPKEEPRSPARPSSPIPSVAERPQASSLPAQPDPSYVSPPVPRDAGDARGTRDLRSAPAGQAAVRGEQLQGERRTVTALVAVVTGFTVQGGPIDVETRAEVMNRVLPILEVEIDRYGGRVDRYREDGLVAFYGAPVTHEDDPERAVLAALAVQEAVQPYVSDLSRREGIALSLRVGINTGDVIASSVGDRRQHWAASVIDPALDLTGQAAYTPESCTVSVASDTYRLLSPLFEWESLGEIAVQGEGQPVAVYRPLAPRAAPGKGRGIEGLASPLVGRDTELQALREAIERLQSGIGGIVTVAGEAGIGKSRLVAEIGKPRSPKRSGVGWANQQIGRSAVPGPQSAAEDGFADLHIFSFADFQWIEGRCLSYATGSAYQLWRDMLNGWLGVAPDAPPAAVRRSRAEMLRERVWALCADRTDDVYPYLGRMMSLPLEDEVEARLGGLDAESLQFITFRAVETLLASAAAQQPLVVVCEDLHWADPTSLALLERLLALTDRLPLLFICVLRPRREHGCWRVVEAAARDYDHRHTGLQLRPLSPQQSATLVGNLLHVEDLPEDLRARILDHAEGNPFYVEEILRSLIDGGTVVHDQVTNRWRATRDVSDIPIPDTLHGVLAARIDRLPEETRLTLQLASVIGRIFAYPVLSAISASTSSPPAGGRSGKGDGPLDAHLVALERAQLIRRRARLPERAYIFKHHLTQEAAYSGLLRRERRAAHRQVAETLERLYPERLEEQLGLLAHHWEQAGESERAVAYLRRAGEQAAAQFANDEAVGYLSRALELTPEDDLSGRLALLLVRDVAYFLQGMPQAQQQDLSTMQLLAEALDDDGQRAAVAVRQAHYAIMTGRNPITIRLQLERALSLARDAGWRQVELQSLHQLGNVCNILGDFVEAKAYHEQFLRIARETGDRKREAGALRSLCHTLQALGDYAQAKAYGEHSLCILRAIGAGGIEGHTLFALGLVSTALGDYVGAKAYHEQALRISEAIGDRWNQGRVFGGLGWACMGLGDYIEARSYYERALSISRETDYRLEESLALAFLALLSCYLGDVEAAQEYGQETLSTIRSTGVRHHDAYALTALGHALACLGQIVEAATVYRQALDIQRELDQPHLVAEPLGGLAHVSLIQGDSAQALAHVEEILSHLEDRPALEGTIEPLRVYLTCYHVLRAVDDPRAEDVLDAAYGLLQERAAKIEDEELRRSYLENVPYHREIVAAWEGSHG